MAKLGYSRILLMRSGRTEWDLLGRVQGATDLPMAPDSPAKVQSQLRELEGGSVETVYCAPDEASRQTAKLLTAEVAAKRAAAVPALGEMALGLWEGLRHEELEGRFCRAGRLFLDDPSGVMAPDGEQMSAYATRVHAAVSKLIYKRNASAGVAIVVRPLALGVIRCLLNNADLGQLWAMLKDRPDVEWVPGTTQRAAPGCAPPSAASIGLPRCMALE